MIMLHMWLISGIGVTMVRWKITYFILDGSIINVIDKDFYELSSPTQFTRFQVSKSIEFAVAETGGSINV